MMTTFNTLAHTHSLTRSHTSRHLLVTQGALGSPSVWPHAAVWLESICILHQDALAVARVLAGPLFFVHHNYLSRVRLGCRKKRGGGDLFDCGHW